MPEKQKKVNCLTDLMAEEMTEVKEMVEEGCFDYFDEDDDEIDREWSRMLKELEALGFTDKIEQNGSLVAKTELFLYNIYIRKDDRKCY